MPVCCGRNWPNGPRTHQGGCVGRPWPWLLRVLPTEAYDRPPSWAPGIIFGPVPITGPFDPPSWAPLVAVPDWDMLLWMDRKPSGPPLWECHLELFFNPTLSLARFDSGFYDAMPSPPPGMTLQLEVPAFWYGPAPAAAGGVAVLYEDLPADFCGGE